MSITVNLYYTGENGNARKFAEEMERSGPMMGEIAALREKYDLHMKVERFISDDDGVPDHDRNL